MRNNALSKLLCSSLAALLIPADAMTNSMERIDLNSSLLHNHRSTNMSCSETIQGVLKERLKRRFGKQYKHIEEDVFLLDIVEVNDYRDLQYLGNFMIGAGESKQGPFSLILDTGSSDMWVPTRRCDSCKDKTKYFPEKPPSNSSLAKFEIEYHAGSAKGQCFSDNVEFKGMDLLTFFGGIESQTIGSFYSTSFMDGIFGFAFPRLQRVTPIAFPWVQQLWLKDLICEPQFAFALASDGSSFSDITLGGYDKGHVKGELTWIPVTRLTHWQSRGLDIGIRASDKKVLKLFRDSDFIVDSGATLSYVRPNVFDALVQALDKIALKKGANKGVRKHGMVFYQCNLAKYLNHLVFTIGGRDFVIPWTSMFTPLQTNKKYCNIGIAGLNDVPSLGNLVLRALYVPKLPQGRHRWSSRWLFHQSQDRRH